MYTTHLERHDSDGHHTEVDHREGVFPPEEARVKKSEARDHDPYEGHCCESPGDVTWVVDDVFTRRVIPVDGTG
jgi:hypothetical protein